MEGGGKEDGHKKTGVLPALVLALKGKKTPSRPHTDAQLQQDPYSMTGRHGESELCAVAIRGARDQIVAPDTLPGMPNLHLLAYPALQ